MSKTILVVDDSEAMRKFLSLSLKIKGYEVVTAEDGIKALEKFPSERIDLMITDLNMPYLDGIGLISNIRESKGDEELPIIILSTIENENQLAEGTRVGANSFLPKPFDIEKMQDEVSHYLDKK